MPDVLMALEVPQTALLQTDAVRTFIVNALSQLLVGELERLSEGVKRGTPVDQGILRGSVHTTFEREPADASLLIRGTVQSGPEAPYARFVEEGTGIFAGNAPFLPNIEALRPWARRVLGDEDAAPAVAFAILARGGTPGAHMFENAFAADRANITRNLVDEWGRIVAALNQQ